MCSAKKFILSALSALQIDVRHQARVVYKILSSGYLNLLFKNYCEICIGS